jgi:hypothetical protein
MAESDSFDGARRSASEALQRLKKSGAVQPVSVLIGGLSADSVLEPAAQVSVSYGETPFEPLSDGQSRLLLSFQEHHVEFVVIGGYAVRVHGVLRGVADLDLVVNNNETNLQRLFESLTALDILRAAEIIELFRKSKKAKWPWSDEYVDLLSTLESYSFDELSVDAIEVHHEEMCVRVISKELLIESKRIALSNPGRGPKALQDREDLDALLGSGG